MNADRQELEARAALLGLTWRSTLSTAKLRERVESAEVGTVPTVRNMSGRTYTIGSTKLNPGADYVLDNTDRVARQVARMVELGVFKWL